MPTPLQVDALPLPRLQREVSALGSAAEVDVARLAAELALAPAEVRGLLSWYDDLREPPGSTRICRGTSCTLAGAALLARAAEDRGTCRAVQCLGACDRSPALLTPAGELRMGVAAWTFAGQARAASHEAPPSAWPRVRSAVDPPLVVGRLTEPGAQRLARARELGVWSGLEGALSWTPRALIETVLASGQRGRGGAGFSTGTKWQACARAPGETKYVIANGDEGDPGSFVDRALLEDDPHAVLEGLALCAYAVGAREGLVFIRSEYPAARQRMVEAIDEARAAGLLGAAVLGSSFAFDVQVFSGLGSYVCGEETALLEAIEGRRGEVRLRPPYPVTSGLYGRPTVVNNVETLASVAAIAREGPERYRALGTAASPGTKALCLNHGFARPGIVEVELGISLREVIEDLGGGGRDGAPIRWVWVGGPMGSIVPPEEWDVPVCFDAMAERGVQLGHGGLVAVLADDDPRELLWNALDFFASESCGKCVPCSLGSARARTLVRAGGAWRRAELEGLLRLSERASLCAFGRLIPAPIRRLLELAGDELLGDGP